MVNRDGVDRKPLSSVWVVGGSLLIAVGILNNVLGPAGLLLSMNGVIESVVFAAALLVYAIGIRGQGSITNRRPLGTIALIGFGAWGIINAVVIQLLATGSELDALRSFSLASTFIGFAIAAIAVIQIARARVLPQPWNWIPTWVLAAMTVSWLVQWSIAQTQSSTAIQIFLPIDTFIRLGAPFFLGIASILLAQSRDSQKNPRTPNASVSEDSI